MQFLRFLSTEAYAGIDEMVKIARGPWCRIVTEQITRVQRAMYE